MWRLYLVSLKLTISLGIILWQIIEEKTIPPDPLPMVLRQQMLNDHLKNLTADCLNPIPTSRPSAAVVAQRFLDHYNDCCARQIIGEPDLVNFINLKDLCRKQLEQCRGKGEKTSIKRLSPEEIDLLLRHEDSWDHPAGLRLAPEICFLIGAGLFYGFMSPEHPELTRTSISQDTKLLKGIPAL